MSTSDNTTRRWEIAIRGTVQGVGFRPFVYRLATRLGLSGFVTNQGGYVTIEAEGQAQQLEQLVADLRAQLPPLARIDSLDCKPIANRGATGFRIAESIAQSGSAVDISPDVATCPDCLRELLDAGDRRFRYPFINCTNCGPRLTIITGSPYDRARTTMAGFAMCAACRAEYENPSDRRFHAEPSACAICGPALYLANQDGYRMESVDPITSFAVELKNGSIGALKGLGGYHLTCDATCDDAVALLRQRKRREEKPFAVMVADVTAARTLCELSATELAVLTSPSRPIVLLRRCKTAKILAAVAPGNPQLGVMLPYTPLHHLLMQEMNGRPLVMTSGNKKDEPIAISEPEVFAQLAGLADLYLSHNRPIQVRCDDSVTRVIGGSETVIRRSRGYAPRPMALAVDAPTPGIAVGGQLKSTFALLSNNRALMSHHLGDLDEFDAFRSFERDIDLYERTFDLRPTWIAHDLHPDYASTRYAVRRAQSQSMPAIAVQHHHAHMASCMVEHGRTEPVIGVTFDGTGFGTDGTVWGGEFLVGDLKSFTRAAHFRTVAMPGADLAIRQPWRMALSHLLDAEIDPKPILHRLDSASIKTAARMIERKFNSPMTSSVGRLFDAVGCLIGLRDHASYEGQAAIELEWEALDAAIEGSYPFELSSNQSAIVIDTRPFIREITQDVNRAAPKAFIARRFHTTVAQITLTVCQRIREATGLSTVVLSGGVFMNSLLVIEVASELSKHGFCPLRHSRVPANDGGISLGQLAVAAARLAPH